MRFVSEGYPRKTASSASGERQVASATYEAALAGGSGGGSGMAVVVAEPIRGDGSLPRPGGSGRLSAKERRELHNQGGRSHGGALEKRR